MLDIRADDVVLPVPKLFFGYARDLAALFPFGVGATGVIFAERTTPELIFELIARHRPTILVNVPTMMQAMLDHPSAASQDLSCLRLCTSAGEALPEPLHRRWDEAFGVEVLDGIGSSEAYHIYISNRPGRVRPGTIGEVVPGYAGRGRRRRWAAARRTGRSAGSGSRGESAAADVLAGCRPRPRETFADGLVMSGDLVERDADGYFTYRGRADDLLKVGGIWVAPAEIERCLGDASRRGRVRGGRGRTRRADAAAAPGWCSGRVRRRRPEALRQFVRERLAPHKVPREVRFVAELPRTGSGKIDRTALRAASLPAGDTGRQEQAMTRFRASAGFTERWQHFDFSVADGVATITLARPEKLGALTFDVYADLRDLLAELPHRGRRARGR